MASIISIEEFRTLDVKIQNGIMLELLEKYHEEKNDCKESCNTFHDKWIRQDILNSSLDVAITSNCRAISDTAKTINSIRNYFLVTMFTIILGLVGFIVNLVVKAENITLVKQVQAQTE